MATAYTAPTTYKGYEDQWDEELLATALTYKQQKYDVNKAKIQNWFNDFATLDLVKEEDRARFAERISQVKEQVNRQGMGDLSLGADHIATYISQAADKGIENGYYGTLRYRQYENEWAKIKEDSPELYNQDNYEYGLTNFMNWTNDRTAGTSVNSYKNTYIGAGVGEVTPYTDIQAEAREIIKEIEPDVYATLDQTGRFTYFKKNGEQVTSSKIIKTLDAALMGSSKIQNQMKINGWANYKNVPDEVFVEGVKNMYNAQVDKYEDILVQLKQERIGASAENTLIIDDNIKYYEEQKKVYSDLSIDDPQSILAKKSLLTTQLYKEDFLKGMGDAFSYNKVTDVGFEIDQGELSIWKENQANNRFYARLNFDKNKAEGDDFTDITKAYLSDGMQGAILTGRAKGFPTEFVQSLIIGSPNSTPLPISTPQEQADFVRATLNGKVFETGQSLIRAENNIIDLFFTKEGKDSFGLQDNNKVGLAVSDHIKNITEEQFNQYVDERLLQGSYAQFKDKLYEYSNIEEANGIYNNIKAKVDEEINIIAEQPYQEFKNRVKLDEKIDLSKRVGGTPVTIANSGISGADNMAVAYNNGVYVLTTFSTAGKDFDRKRNEKTVLSTSNINEVEDYIKTNLKETKVISDQIYQYNFENIHSLATPLEIRGEDPLNVPMVEQAYMQLSSSRIPDEFKNAISVTDKSGSPTGELDFSRVNININEGTNTVTFKAGDSSVTEDLSLFNGVVKNNLISKASIVSGKQYSATRSAYYMNNPITRDPIEMVFENTENPSIKTNVKVEFKKADGLFYPLLTAKGEFNMQYYILPEGTPDIAVAESAAIQELNKIR